MLPSTAKFPVVPGMETELACVVVHASVLDPPSVIVDGVALKESITHAGAVQVIVVDEEYAFFVPLYALIR